MISEEEMIYLGYLYFNATDEARQEALELLRAAVNEQKGVNHENKEL